MGAFFSALIAKIVGIATYFGKLAVAVFLAAWDLIRDAVAWPFEQLLSIVQSAVTAIDVSGISGNLGTLPALPAEVLNVLGLLGVGTAIAMISAALLIRLGLQLIPFVRLGS